MIYNYFFYHGSINFLRLFGPNIVDPNQFFSYLIVQSQFAFILASLVQAGMDLGEEGIGQGLI